jgi:hypothetical protein
LVARLRNNFGKAKTSSLIPIGSELYHLSDQSENAIARLVSFDARRFSRKLTAKVEIRVWRKSWASSAAQAGPRDRQLPGGPATRLVLPCTRRHYRYVGASIPPFHVSSLERGYAQPYPPGFFSASMHGTAQTDIP